MTPVDCLKEPPYYDLEHCAFCFKAADENTLKKCKNCRSVAYCGTPCQTSGWTAHKFYCKIHPRAQSAAQRAYFFCQKVRRDWLAGKITSIEEADNQQKNLLEKIRQNIAKARLYEPARREKRLENMLQISNDMFQKAMHAAKEYNQLIIEFPRQFIEHNYENHINKNLRPLIQLIKKSLCNTTIACADRIAGAEEMKIEDKKIR